MFWSRNDLEGSPSKYGEGLGSFLKPATLEIRTKARVSMPGLAHLPSCPSFILPGAARKVFAKTSIMSFPLPLRLERIQPLIVGSSTKA